MGLIKSTPAAVPEEDMRKQGRDCDHLQSQLQSASANERRWAARDLVDCPDAASALVAQLHAESNRSVREVIFTTLTMLANAAAVDGLVACLRSEEAALRNEAIEAMKQLPEQVAPMMQQLLQDAEADVRIFAVNVLESLRHPSVEDWLIAVIAQDAHVNVCAAAVDLLTEIGTEHAVEPLRALKARFASEPYIQFAADIAIKRILAD